LEKKWLEGNTGLKNDPQGRQVFPLAGTPLGKFLATLLRESRHRIGSLCYCFHLGTEKFSTKKKIF
jgi:hypothetical protein